MDNDAAYPKERGEKKPGEGIFALRFTRVLTKRALAQETGPLAVLMLIIIVHQEDACHYRRGVTFYDAQFMFLLGINSKKTMTSIRRRLVESGWLHYEPGHRGKASTYWVLVPAEARGLDDKPTDESHDDCGSLKEPNEGDSVPQSEQKGNRKGFDREPKGGLFIPIPIPDPITPHTPASDPSIEESNEEQFPQQRPIGKKPLILPEIIKQELRVYLPEVQRDAWELISLHCEQSGERSSRTKAKLAKAYADAVVEYPGAKEALTNYLSVTDPQQLDSEFKAGLRLAPGAMPWDIVDHLFKPKERKSHASRNRNPAVAPAGGRNDPDKPLDVPNMQ